MKRYFRIYTKLLSLNLSALFAYRVDLFNEALSSVVWSTLQVVGILILTSKTSSTFGWSREELIILVAVFNIFRGFFDIFFAENFERFSEVINKGELDVLLTKPVDAQFSMSCWLISYASGVRVLLGLGILLYLILTYQIPLALIQVLFFMILTSISVITIYSVWFLFMTLNIWFTKLHNLVDLMYQVNGFTRFPKEMYQNIRDIFFYLILPLTLIVATPTRALLNKNSISDLTAFLIFTLILFYLSRNFWKFALRFYTSASS